MPLGRELGEAFVSVRADTAPFGRELAQKLRIEYATLERQSRESGEKLGEALVDGILRSVRRRLPIIRGQIAAMLRGLRVNLTVDVDVDVRQGRGLSGGAGGGLLARLRGNMQAEVTREVGSMYRGIQGTLGKLFRGPGGIAGMFLAGELAATALAGAFNAVGREALQLSGILGFLPGAISILGAYALTANLAFSGMDDAITAVFERDPKKLQEAMKGMTKSAQDFVMDLKAALPVFDRIKNAAQEGFFKNITDLVPKLTGGLGGTLQAGVGKVAESAGQFVSKLGNMLASPETRGFLERVFQVASALITTLSGPVIRLLESFRNMANASLPQLKDIGTAVGTLLDKFAKFINDKVASGEFAQWLQDGIDTFNDLKDLFVETGKLLGVLFDDGNDDGRSFIQVITDLIIRFREFAASPEGQRALDGIATAAKLAGAALIAVGAVVWVIIASIGSLIWAVKEALNWLGLLETKKKMLKEKSTIQFASQPAPKADGGIIEHRTFAELGEAGREVVIPLTRPDRARQLARDSGLLNLLGGTSENVKNVFYLGTEQVDARMVRVARDVQQSSARTALAGLSATI